MKKTLIYLGLLAGIVSFLARGAEAATYYAAASGSDENAGTISRPFKTLQYALTRLKAGDTLHLRQGTYYEGDIPVSLAGTADHPILVQAHPGERAIIDGGVPDYKTVPNTGWELVDAKTQLYRSKRVHRGRVGAWLINDDTQLIQYQNAANLESTNYAALHGNDPFYFGPGVQLREDGRLYIRLQPNPRDLFAPEGKPLPPVPADPDPNQNALAVFSTYTLLKLEGSAYVRFKDLTFQYARRIIEWRPGTHHIVLENCTLNYGTIGIVSRGGDAAEIAGCRFNNGIPATLYWTDVKNPDDAGGESYPEFQSGAMGSISNLYVHGCVFQRSFDGLSFRGAANVTIRNNCFLHVKDDAINLSLDVNNVEIDHNLFWDIHSGISLFAHTGTPGEVFIHHNVIDGSILTRTGRAGNYRQRAYPPYMGANMFGGHDGRSPAHWKVYNNTFISRQSRQPLNGMGARAVVGNSSKYFYNNIFYALDDRSLLSDDQESSGSHYDGNLYWQKKSGKPMFADFAHGANFASLAELRASPSTWEAKGLQIDPGFDPALLTAPTLNPKTIQQRYLPSNSQVLTAGAPYSGLKWPGTEGISYRGAISPDNPWPKEMKGIMMSAE